eukprot:GHUV01030958.1.p1 GENE.GHUV01030958.1~~GHUV01030958.1.p1  ORF type:complete len:196 (-),score=32.13 GHUV01030958.1:100-687(-)
MAAIVYATCCPIVLYCTVELCCCDHQPATLYRTSGDGICTALELHTASAGEVLIGQSRQLALCFAAIVSLQCDGICMMPMLMMYSIVTLLYCCLPTQQCRFTFQNGVLTCDVMPQPTGTPPGTLTSKLQLERIIILGLPTNKSYTATVGSKSFSVLSGLGVDVRISQGDAVVINAAGLPIGSDWQLRVSEEVAAA